MSRPDPSQPEPFQPVTPADAHERFLALYTPAQRRVHAYIMSLAPDPVDADDVLQETSIVLWRKFAEYDGSRPFVAWACGIARLEVFRHQRARGRRMLPLDERTLDLLDAAHAEVAECHEQRRRALDGCVTKLSDADRDLVSRCYGSGEKFMDVAASLGRPVNSVYKSLGRIRAALADCIEHTIRASDPERSRRTGGAE